MNKLYINNKKILMGIILIFFIIGCGGNGDGNGNGNSFCLRNTHDFVASIWKIKTDNSIYEWYYKDLEGLSSFVETKTVEGETHVVDFSNIILDYNERKIISFNVKVDSIAYSFPEDTCYK